MRIFLLILFLFPNISSGQEPFALFGGYENDEASQLLRLENGSFLLLGTYRSSLYNQSGICLYTINAKGKLQETFKRGNRHQNIATDISLDPQGNYVITGHTWDLGPGRFDFLYLKISPKGDVLEKRGIGTWQHDDRAFSIETTEDGSSFVLGWSRLKGPSGDMYFTKVTHSGWKTWERNYGSDYPDYGRDILVTKDGFLLLGTLGGYEDYIYTPKFEKDADIILVKTDKEGKEQWRKRYGGLEHDLATKIIAAKEGGYYILGSSQSEGAGNFDMLLIKIKANGEEEWQKHFGGSKLEYAADLNYSTDEYLYILGSSRSFSENGKPDIYLVKTDENGIEYWSKTFGLEGSDYGVALQAIPNGGCAIGATIQTAERGKELAFFQVDDQGDFFVPSDTVPRLENQFFPGFKQALLKVKGEGTYSLKVYDLEGKQIVHEDFKRKELGLERSVFASPRLYQLSLNGEVISSGRFYMPP